MLRKGSCKGGRGGKGGLNPQTEVSIIWITFPPPPHPSLWSQLQKTWPKPCLAPTNIFAIKQDPGHRLQIPPHPSFFPYRKGSRRDSKDRPMESCRWLTAPTFGSGETLWESIYYACYALSQKAGEGKATWHSDRQHWRGKGVEKNEGESIPPSLPPPPFPSFQNN